MVPSDAYVARQCINYQTLIAIHVLFIENRNSHPSIHPSLRNTWSIYRMREFPSIQPSILPCIQPSIHLSDNHPSIQPAGHPSVHLVSYLSIHLVSYPSIHLAVHPSIKPASNHSIHLAIQPSSEPSFLSASKPGLGLGRVRVRNL